MCIGTRGTSIRQERKRGLLLANLARSIIEGVWFDSTPEISKALRRAEFASGINVTGLGWMHFVAGLVQWELEVECIFFGEIPHYSFYAK